MTLVTAVGGASSNSYATISYAETFLSGLIPAGLKDDWTGLDTTGKEFQMIMAAAAMGFLPLRGRRSYRNQILDFPRDCQATPAIMPDAVKQAQSLIAYDLVQPSVSAFLDEDEDVPAEAKDITSVQIGPLTVNFGEGSILGSSTMLRLIKSSTFPIQALLKPYLTTVRGSAVRNADQIWADEATLLTTTT